MKFFYLPISCFLYSILELKACKEEVSVLKTKYQTLQEENVGKLVKINLQAFTHNCYKQW